jgi:hypothetical protein
LDSLPNSVIELSQNGHGQGAAAYVPPAVQLSSPSAEAAAATPRIGGGTDNTAHTQQNSNGVSPGAMAVHLVTPEVLDGTSHLSQGAADTKGNITAALLNYRTYVLAAAYAISFGVELAVNNILVKYLFEHFDLELAIAGALGKS